MSSFDFVFDQSAIEAIVPDAASNTLEAEPPKEASVPDAASNTLEAQEPKEASSNPQPAADPVPAVTPKRGTKRVREEGSKAAPPLVKSVTEAAKRGRYQSDATISAVLKQE